MLSMHILLPKQANFKNIRTISNLGCVIMSTRENIRLIARAPYVLGTEKNRLIDIVCLRTHNIWASARENLSS